MSRRSLIVSFGVLCAGLVGLPEAVSSGALRVEVLKHTRATAAWVIDLNHHKQLGNALHYYSMPLDDNMPIHGIGSKGLPLGNEAEKPLLSWRVALLPHLGEKELYKKFKLDEPWDGANNKKLIDKMPRVYAPVVKPGKPGYTHMQMVIGPKAMPLFANLKFSFTDGTSNTVAIVEAAEPVIWTKPDDVMFPGKELPKDFRKKFGGQFQGGFHVTMWDGSVRFVRDTVSDRTLGDALTPDGDEILGPDW